MCENNRERQKWIINEAMLDRNKPSYNVGLPITRGSWPTHTKKDWINA